MTMISSEMLHASCVAIGGRGVLIEGLSGSGKSDLALRLIDRGATLVSDDYTQVRREGGSALASAGPNIAGMIEVRGVGIVPFACESDVPVALIVSVGNPVARLPEMETRVLVGLPVTVIALSPFEASAPIKVELALRAVPAP